MGRRRDDSPWMTIFDLFTRLPWPLGVGIGILVFLAMRFLLPLRFGNDPSDTMWKTLLCTGPLPYLVAGAFVGGGVVSAVRSAGRRKLYQGQQSLGDIRSLSWREFETYVGELRTARRGANAGNPFYGCSRYPHCRGIVQASRG